MEGKAERPVWINIINDQVKIEDAKELWGLDTWSTQDRITAMVGGRTRFGEEWQEIGSTYTTARPQIVCIGPVGETKSRLAALISGSGISARIGGHAAVFGAKNLKAISVTGTGRVQVSDPKGVVDARLRHMEANQTGAIGFASGPGAASCMPCLRGDRRRSNYNGGETMCACQGWLSGSKTPGASDMAAEALIKYGLSSWSAHFHAMSTEIAGAPEFFHGKVPVDSGLGWYLQYPQRARTAGSGKADRLGAVAHGSMG